MNGNARASALCGEPASFTAGAGSRTVAGGPSLSTRVEQKRWPLELVWDQKLQEIRRNESAQKELSLLFSQSEGRSVFLSAPHSI